MLAFASSYLCPPLCARAPPEARAWPEAGGGAELRRGPPPSAATDEGENPLARHALTRVLLFIDGRRAVEVAWALAHEGPAKIVLLAGRPLELSRRHGRPFFFDQGGRLAARFALAATPSLVEQAGTRLRITEIPLEDRTGKEAAR